MRWIFKRSVTLASVVIGLSFGISAAAQAKGTLKDACQSLARPNIDCACVATRIETYQKFSPTPEAKAMIAQTYLRDLGLENDFETSAKTAFRDPMQQVGLEMALDPLGGTPTNIEDLETGCVIAGAAPIAIKMPRAVQSTGDFSAQNYMDRCQNSVGSDESGQRYCQCTAERLTYRLNDREFEAKFRSFGQAINQSTRSDGAPNSRADDYQTMARAMGVSVQSFKQFLFSASQKTDPFEAQDTAYCTSRLWADKTPGQTADMRKLAGFEPGVLMSSGQVAPVAPDLTSGSKRAQAAAIVSEDCTSNGNSDAYCACYIRDFEARVVPASADDDTTLAFALMTGGAALSSLDYMAAVQSVPQSAHQSAAMMLMSVPDLGETCTQGTTSAPAPMNGTPAERMTDICVQENDNEALCQCMTGQLEEKLSPDDFELIVDIREADAQGADDPLAKVADDRGLSKSEAEEAMAMNRSMMGAMMGMDMMACVGGMPSFPQGMPDLSSIPGMPRQ